MNHHTNTAANSGLPVFSGIVTVPGTYFLPLVNAMIDATAWCARKTSDLIGR
jgi:hypothetical protein